MSYINENGLSYLWGKIKSYIASHSPVTSVNNQTGDVTLNIPTVPSNIVTGLNSSGTATAYTIKVVDSMPDTPDSSTIYLVTGS